MNPKDVYDVLKERRIDVLFHANSVQTSVTFLQQKALLSRGYVESKGLSQTPQYSDAKDKSVGVWNDVFIDTDDYHNRIRRLNQYGPVVFGVRSEILNTLGPGSEVLVTKSNPTKWIQGQTAPDRYYTTRDELADALVRGTFDQMITVRTPSAALSFGSHLVNLVVDNPSQAMTDGRDATSAAVAALDEAAKNAGLPIRASVRMCRSECRCLEEYAAKWPGKFRGYF